MDVSMLLIQLASLLGSVDPEAVGGHGKGF